VLISPFIILYATRCINSGYHAIVKLHTRIRRYTKPSVVGDVQRHLRSVTTSVVCTCVF